MAQKLLLRPFLSFPLKQLSPPLCRQPAWLLCRLSTAPCSITWHTPLPFTAMPVTVRTFSTTQVFRHTFNVQDGDDFQDRVLKSQTPVVIDFHAQWCGPCKILGPRLEKMVAKHNGKVLMAKVDIDDHTDLALEYEKRNRVGATYLHYQASGFASLVSFPVLGGPCYEIHLTSRPRLCRIHKGRLSTRSFSPLAASPSAQKCVFYVYVCYC
ncbi:hypothetical protein JRQ81_016319 [Phrynocephalus forsythii]|uniref:Thioredoxin domain-containing protein n=1 Tax=Phrynocephalus forsythii TaxID=171643 RepID=A0A9Q0XW84_9SAUR|nr:hypothetical protein JRQ81_016319 [Phrynocephalus forsythii]